jgi:hypothetical protein
MMRFSLALTLSVFMKVSATFAAPAPAQLYMIETNANTHPKSSTFVYVATTQGRCSKACYPQPPDCGQDTGMHAEELEVSGMFT